MGKFISSGLLLLCLKHFVIEQYFCKVCSLYFLKEIQGSLVTPGDRFQPFL
ncbi:hypothetical protein J2T02_004933 [Chitinophaga terrae (ex Kim and Jung 2007)]|nr:hypothetical protein [Chitinophaga terrae (ex Kim and Jung 2007)]